MRSSAHSTRRALLALVAPLLAGCGFRPVFGRRDHESDSVAELGLAQIAVGLIPDRAGQLLRNALQERFERSGISRPRKYDLSVTYNISSEGVGIRQDFSASRVRYVARASYTLTAQDASRTTLTTGAARALDGLDVYFEQFFAQDLETEAVQRRVAEVIADQITLQLASYFDHRAAAGNG